MIRRYCFCTFNMTEKSKDILKNIWLNFLETGEQCKEEKEHLMDIFLQQFIHLDVSGEKPRSSEYIDWSSVGNQLMHYFMSDIHEICSQEMQTMNKTSQSTGNVADCNMDVIELLHHYTLQKRGWKLLYALNSIGLQGVTCTKEVIDLFTSLFSICLQLPVDLSVNSAILKIKKDDVNIETYFALKKRSKQLMNHPSCKMNIVRRYRQTHRKPQHKKSTVSKNDDTPSNSDGEEQINSHCIMKKLKSLMQSKADNEIGTTDATVCYRPEKLLIQKESHMSPQSVSLTSFCTYMIEILLQISFLEQQNSHASSFIPSELILSFALETLDSLQAERFNISQWPLDDVLNVKRNLLKIVAATLSTEMKVKGCTGINNLFAYFLTTANAAISDIENKEKHKTSTERKDILFYSETIVISFLWILKTTEVSVNNENAALIVQTVRTFSNNGGLLMCCNLISYVESHHWPTESKIQIISKIVNIIRDIVISLKKFRLAFSLYFSKKNDLVQFAYLDTLDHHSNILGLPSSHSVLNKNPLCCIATMSSLLLELFQIVNSNSFQVIIIGALRKCGTCCCLNFNETVYNLLENISKCTRNVQLAIFVLIERTIVKQFGLTSYNENTCCEICNRRNICTKLMKKDKFNDKDDLKSSSDEIFKDNWNVFKLYYDYLTTDDTLSDIIGNSLLNLILIGNENLRKQLFVQVILPSFLFLSQHTLSSSFKDKIMSLEFCMLSLPPLLQSSILSEIFLTNNGLHNLCNLFELPYLQNIALYSLKVLIISQSENYNFISLDRQSSSKHSIENALMYFESLLFQITSRLSVKLSGALNETSNKPKSVHSDPASSENLDEYNQEYISSANSVIFVVSKFRICLEEKTDVLFLCDLWSTCSELVCKIPSFKKYMSCYSKTKFVYHVFGIVFNMLYNFNETSEILRNAAKILLQSVLTVHLDLASSDDMETNEVYQMLNKHLKKSHPEKIEDLQAVFEILFQCMAHTCERQSIFKRRNYEKFPHYEEECSFLSDSSEEIDAEDEGYDADTEIDHRMHSDLTKLCTRAAKLSTCNPHLCSIILDFLTYCNDRCQQNMQWLSTLSYVTKQFVHLCHQAFENRLIMHKQGLLRNIFTTFKTILTSPLKEYEEIQRNMMDLFILIGNYSISKEELELFIELFKIPSAPMVILLQGFNQLIKLLPCMPSAYLCFPVSQESYHANEETDSSIEEDKNEYHPLRDRHSLYKCNANLNIQICSWKMSAIFLPLREDGLWHPLQNGFSVSIWLAFGHPLATPGNIQNIKKWKSEKGSSYESSCDGSKQLTNGDNVYHVLSVGTELMFEMWIAFNCGEVIFRITQLDDDGAYKCHQETSFSNLLEPHRWLHIGINYKEAIKKEIILGEVIFIVDGYKETKFFFNYSSFSDKCLHSCSLLGHRSVDYGDNNNNIYYLSNVMFFQDTVLTKEQCYYLSQLGPDIRSLTDCCLESRPMFYCHNLTPNMLESGIDIEILTCLKIPSVKSLQEKLLAVYSSNDPSTLIVYPNVFSTVISLLAPLPSFQTSFKVVANDQRPSQQQPVNKRISVKQNIISLDGLQHTIQAIGGIRLLIFLFGRVVECSRDEQSHAIALKLILCFLQKDARSYTIFQEMQGIKLLSRVLLDEKCITSYHILQVFLHACLSSSILQIDSVQMATVDINSYAIIVNPHIFKAMLSIWQAWEKVDFGVMKALFMVLQVLIRDRHPYQSYNLSQMLSINVIDIIISILEEKFVNMDKSLSSTEMGMIIPWLIRKLLGTPVNLALLKSIFDCMLLLHQASRTYICHARSSFYFLFSKFADDTRINQAENSFESNDCLTYDANIDLYEAEASKLLKGQTNHDIVQKITNTNPEHKHRKILTSSNNEKKGISMSAVATDIESAIYKNINEFNRELISSSDNNWQEVNKEYPIRIFIGNNTADNFSTTKSNCLQQNGDSKAIKFSNAEKQCVEQSTNNLLNSDEQENDMNKVKLIHISQKVEREEEVNSSSLHCNVEAASQNNEKWKIVSLQDEIVDQRAKGITTLYTGLIHILRETIVTCPDSSINEIISIIKPDALIVFAHHPCSAVACSAVMALDAYLQRGSDEDVNNFLKIKGFHMLANQLYQFPATSELLSSCLTIIAGHPSKLEEQETDFGSPLELNPVQLMACIPLLALIPNTSHDIVLCHNAMSRLHQLLSQVPSVHKTFLENGLMESIGKLLSKVTHSKPNPTDIEGENEEDLIYEDVYRVINIVVTQLVSSNGANNFRLLMNVLYLFSGLESYSCKFCDVSCTCTAIYRNCQCAVLTAACDYIIMSSYGTMQENYSSNRSKTVSSDSIHSDSILDILVNLPEMMNPYPFHVTSYAIQSTMQGTPFSILLGSRSKLPGYKQRNLSHNLSFTEIVDRFRQIFTKAIDFLVYKDKNSPWTQQEKEFAQDLLHITLNGMIISLERFKGPQKTVWSTMMSSSLRETVRVQFGRLFIALLTPEQPIDLKISVLRLLLAQENCRILLNYIFQASFHNTSRIAVLIHSLLYNHTDNISENEKKEICIFSELLTQCKVKIPDEFEASQFIEETKKSLQEETKEGYKKWQLAKENMEKSVLSQYDSLVKNISENAMDITRTVVDAQNLERKKFMAKIKIFINERLEVQKEWCYLVEQLAHKRAAWYLKEFYPHSWELDPTESPLRVRRRLRRCYLNIEPRFLLPEYRNNLEVFHDSLPLSYLYEMKSETDETAALIDKLHNDDKISYNCCCQIISSSVETPGEILIGEKCIHFVVEKSFTKGNETASKCQAWLLEDIREVLPRRYELQDNALEVFLSNGLTHLIAFHSNSKREEFCSYLMQCSQLCLIAKKTLTYLTAQWRERSITNFEYLTELNKIAGRSFNDLMQYPVFPFILSDYSSLKLNLCDANAYRNFSKPIAIQNKSREKHYIDSYNCLKAEFDSSPSTEHSLPITGPYHYGSHYSNSGTVLHFLVRLLPFTKMFLEYQDDNFDIPDRTFHSLNTSWRLSSGDSTSDVKELIPEFFFLPEFLINSEGFNFGKRQTGERVHNVALPPWCQNDPRLFILINRQALESDIVTSELQKWVDLVFGFKQTGKAAVEAINVFHPATYYGHDISKIEERLNREALEATIRTVGQTPRQLFFSPHPMVELSISLGTEQQQCIKHVLSNVKGIKWGNFVGSPASLEPVLAWRQTYPVPIYKLLPLLTNDVFGLADKTSLLLSHSKDKARGVASATYIMSTALVSWGHQDSILRMKLQRDRPAIPLLQEYSDKITVCASIPDCQLLFIGYKSGIIDVYALKFDSVKLKVHQTSTCVHLYGHSDAINAIFICKAYTVVITASKDCSCIIWDLNRLHYVRSITDHINPIEIVCVSDTLGDIASVSHSELDSCLKVHTINGQLVGCIQSPLRITAMCYSTVQEGTAVNVIAAGLCNGTIMLWNSWNLNTVSEIKINHFCYPITSVTYSCDNHHLYAANEKGVVAMWENPNKGIKKTRFLTLV